MNTVAETPPVAGAVERRWLVIVAFVWAALGTIPLVVRHVDLPPIAIVFSRLVLTAAGLGAVVAWQARSARRSAPRLLAFAPRRVVVTGAVLAVHWSSLFAAYRAAPVGTVILIVYLAPVGVALAAPIALQERVDRATALALVASLAGFLLVAAPAAALVGGRGLALAALSAVTFVAFIVLSKPLAQAYGGLRLAFLVSSVAAAVLAPLAALQPWGRPDATWLWLLVLGLGHTALAQALYLAALAHAPAAKVSILGYLEPVVVLAVGWLFLSEALRTETVVGGALIVIAGIAVIRTAPEVIDVPR